MPSHFRQPLFQFIILSHQTHEARRTKQLSLGIEQFRAGHKQRVIQRMQLWRAQSGQGHLHFLQFRSVRVERGVEKRAEGF